VETRNEEQKPSTLVTEPKEKKRRFEIVKLEERVAPGSSRTDITCHVFCGRHFTHHPVC
jgi:hypothetical protein